MENKVEITIRRMYLSLSFETFYKVNSFWMKTGSFNSEFVTVCVHAC